MTHQCCYWLENIFATHALLEESDTRPVCGEVAHHWMWSISRTGQPIKMWVCSYHFDLMTANGVQDMDVICEA